jgi:hypothetical protein
MTREKEKSQVIRLAFSLVVFQDTTHTDLCGVSVQEARRTTRIQRDHYGALIAYHQRGDQGEVINFTPIRSAQAGVG